VFEIGSGLREARVRRGFELTQVEAGTHIRSRYLKALEDERFDLLPGTAYTRAFLREYADFLDLEAQRFVDEYDARFVQDDELPLAPARPPRRRGPVLDLRVGAGAAIVGAGLLVWAIGWPGGNEVTIASPPPAAVRRPAPPPAPTPVAPRPRAATLVLTAVGGRCWVEARLGSAQGKVVRRATLEQGQSARFTARRLWLRLGAPAGLEATLDGKPVELPNGTASLLVTTEGLRRV
jgi:hypothetical protein